MLPLSPHDAEVDTLPLSTEISAKHVTVSSDEQLIVGSALSIVNVCVQLSVLPQASVIVYVIVY